MGEQLRAWVLNKLKRHRYIGGKHTDENNVRKGADPKDHSYIQDTLKELTKSGHIRIKPTAYGKHVSLNPRIIKEIDEFIQRYFTQVIFK